MQVSTSFVQDISGGNICCGNSSVCQPQVCSEHNPYATASEIDAIPEGGFDSNGYYDATARWSGCPQVVNHPWGPGCVIPPRSSNIHATATFTKVYGKSSNISVTESGNGTGYVLSSPPGIDCGSTCSATINSGLSSYVELDVMPYSASRFARMDRLSKCRFFRQLHWHELG